MGFQSCGNGFICDSDCGIIASVNFPLPYDNNHRCRWHISVNVSSYVRLEVLEFDVHGDGECLTDHVEFYDGQHVNKNFLIGRYCNSVKPPSIIMSSWNALVIEFSTSSEEAAKGFLFRYRSEQYRFGAMHKLIANGSNKNTLFKYHIL